MHIKKLKKGFTLIELLLVIIILGILAALISGNLINSLVKGRDARRKSDLQNIQKAVEMYYEDNRTYPDTNTLNTAITSAGELCYPGAGGTPDCATKVYMFKVPNDPSYNTANSSGPKYYYTTTDATNQHYELFSQIENTQDKGEGVKQTGYTGFTTQCGGICKFGVSDSGTSLP